MDILVISSILPRKDQNLFPPALQLIEKVWCKKEIIRMQMRKFSKPQRVRFISTVDLETKWERYAYGRLINIPPGEHIRLL